ncbi:TetR family transcriptional regulator [Frisingicoccus sp.]|uniref:TetR family transcriptional regulator n=1 Tax=Frisingicoccus sp. TaxID=1918627 RepID=UPI002ED674EC
MAIARTLAVNPDILFMDEPFGALDAITRMKLQDDILEISRVDKKTVIFVTHDIEEAVFLADRIVVMEANLMTDTKENILMTALHLFARDGYEAVSVSAIAGALGMTKGALYRHYKNKRDIFDSIVERMYQIDAERSKAYEVPKETYAIEPETYKHISIDAIKKFTLSQFVFWSEDDFASHFRKMLTLEQYRNPEMAELYSQCMTVGPVAYMEDIFREMILRGVLKASDPRQLAVEFYAPLYLLMNISDQSDEKTKFIELLNHHIDRFVQYNAVQS